jgi:LCP family protein required for cell wall assembly
MAVPRRQYGRSAAVAATLSFLLPGAGQAYVRRWRPALLFGVPGLIMTALLLGEIGRGPAQLAGRLLDPAVALAMLAATLFVAGLRIASVLHAWGSARRTPAAWVVLPLLLVLTIGSHGFAFVGTASMLGAGDRIASGGDSLLEGPSALLPVPVAMGTPTPRPTSAPSPGQVAHPGSVPPGAPAGEASPGPGATPAPLGRPRPGPDVNTDADPYNDEEPEDDLEPNIVSGPAPEFDVSTIETQADGLLNVLIVGIDWRPGRESRRTDTMIIVSVETDTGAVRMFSFPRDISHFPLYTGGTYEGKLNSFAGYASRNAQKYPDGGLKSLSYQLGFLLGIPVDYYAAVDIPGFENVVRAVGGVTVNNEKEIRDTYIDGGSGFFLPAGKHRLNAEDTVKYVRSRHGSSDFARAARQQQVLSALRREMTRPEKLANLPGIMDAISAVLRTDFPRDRLAELIALAEQVDEDATESYVFRKPYWAKFTPRTETTRSVTALRIDRLRELSIRLFDSKSLYKR